MKQKFLVRYLILITILCMCAGIAWKLVQRPDPPTADAVLASVQQRRSV